MIGRNLCRRDRVKAEGRRDGMKDSRRIEMRRAVSGRIKEKGN